MDQRETHLRVLALRDEVRRHAIAHVDSISDFLDAATVSQGGVMYALIDLIVDTSLKFGKTFEEATDLDYVMHWFRAVPAEMVANALNTMEKRG